MRGYVNVPRSIYCRTCKICGARPVIALADDMGYVIKCPNSESHYKTRAGLIDISDWNDHNNEYDCSTHGKADMVFH